MSKSSYIVNADGKLHMIGNGSARLPEGAITRGEAASILLCAPDQLEGEIMALRTGLDTECRTKLIDGELFVHGGDATSSATRNSEASIGGDRLHLHPRHRHRRRERSTSPIPAGLLPRPPPQPSKAQAVTIADAAEQAGSTEEESTTRISAKRRSKMVDGQMVILVSDLNRLAAKGSIPKPSDRQKTDRMLEQIEGKSSRNASVEARTDRMLKTLGMAATARAKRLQIAPRRLPPPLESRGWTSPTRASRNRSRPGEP